MGEVGAQQPLEQQCEGTPMMQGGGWMWVKHAAGNLSCTSQRQLEVERCFAKAIGDKGEEKGPAFAAVRGVKIGYADSSRYVRGVKSTMTLSQNKGNNLTGGKCWFRPHVLSARKDVSMTSRTDATWRNRR